MIVQGKEVDVFMGTGADNMGKTIRFIDLFCGIGGIRLGMES